MSADLNPTTSRAQPTGWATMFLFLAVVAICPIAIRSEGMLGVFALVGMAGFLLSMFTHPLVVFGLYFGALFFKEAKLPGMPVSVNQVLAPLYFLSAFVYILRGKALAPRFALFPVLAVVVLYFVIRGLTAEDMANGLLYARYALIYLVLSVSVAIVLNSERKIYAISWIIVGLTTIAAIHGLWEAFSKNLLGVVSNFWGEQRRVMGTAPNSVVFGWNMIFAYPFAFFLFAQMRSAFTRFLALGMGLFIMAVATFTFNRQTYVIMAIVMVLSAVLYSYKNRAALLGLLGIMGGLGAFTVLPLVFKRLMTVTHLAKDYSYLERQDSFKVGMEMFSQHPIFGVGFGSFSKVWSHYLPPDYSTYFLQYRGSSIAKFMDMGMFSILAETGIVGLALFLLMLFILFRYSWKRRKEALENGDMFLQNLASTVIVGLTFFTVSAFIQDNFLYARIWVLYGIVLLLDKRHLPVTVKSPVLTENGSEPQTGGTLDLPQVT